VSHGDQHPTPLQAVRDLAAAIRDSRQHDIAALTTPDVRCQPQALPGISQYHGHDGLAALARDLHAIHGNYNLTITDATEQPGPQVTTRTRMIPEPGHGQPFTVTTVYTFRDGLIATITSIIPG